MKRLLIPSIFGVLVIVPPQMYYALRFRTDTTLSYLQFYPEFFQMLPPGMSDYEAVGLTWAHLWFILYLLAISLLALPLLLWLRTSAGMGPMSKWAGFLGKGAAILLLALPIPFVRFLLPEIEGQPFFMYMLVFLHGFVLMSDLRYGQALQDIRKAALLLAVVATTILMAAWISKSEFPDFSLPTRRVRRPGAVRGAARLHYHQGKTHASVRHEELADQQEEHQHHGQHGQPDQPGPFVLAHDGDQPRDPRGQPAEQHRDAVGDQDHAQPRGLGRALHEHERVDEEHDDEDARQAGGPAAEFRGRRREDTAPALRRACSLSHG